jgi:hypothetical protein
MLLSDKKNFLFQIFGMVAFMPAGNGQSLAKYGNSVFRQARLTAAE